METTYSEYELYGMFDDMLDEVYGMVEVCGISYDSSNLWKNHDPIAYRCSFLDWLDAEGYVETEIGDEYILQIA